MTTAPGPAMAHATTQQTTPGHFARTQIASHIASSAPTAPTAATARTIPRGWHRRPGLATATTSGCSSCSATASSCSCSCLSHLSCVSSAASASISRVLACRSLSRSNREAFPLDLTPSIVVARTFLACLPPHSSLRLRQCGLTTFRCPQLYAPSDRWIEKRGYDALHKTRALKVKFFFFCVCSLLNKPTAPENVYG